MITCKACGEKVDLTDEICSACGSKITLSQTELDYIYAALKDERRKKNFAEAYTLCKFLADKNYVPAVREWAAILEVGELGEPRLDEAMRYFLTAAEAGDAYSAYRYSRLAGRTSDEASRFWLMFSALLGCKEAFPEVAKILDEQNQHDDATYYYSILAEYEYTDAIVTLARRYHDGIYVPKNDSYAKWYMDKLTIPPIYAIKLAYKLRGVTAKEPPRPEMKNKEATVNYLIRIAEKNKYLTALFSLNRMLHELGCEKATVRLAELMLSGIGTERNIADAVTILKQAASCGSALAYKALGNLYLTGEHTEKNGELALEYYEKSAELGGVGVYEILGDVYAKGEVIKEDLALAAEYYEKGANEGDASCLSKLREIVTEREALFERAFLVEKNSPEIAYASYSKAAAMGHVPAYSALARIYLSGVGAKINRRRARELLEKAVACGDTDALYPLGLCHMRGIGTPLDFKEGKKILLKARALGNPKAEGEIIRALECKKKKAARSLYSRAMRLLFLEKFELAKDSLVAAGAIGCQKATYTLGCFYEFGLGVDTNKDLAYTLYEEAFSGGFRDPRAEYKLVILKILKHKLKTPKKRQVN